MLFFPVIDQMNDLQISDYSMADISPQCRRRYIIDITRSVPSFTYSYFMPREDARFANANAVVLTSPISIDASDSILLQGLVYHSLQGFTRTS